MVDSNSTKSSTNVQDFEAVLNEVSFASGLGDPQNIATGDDKHYTVSWTVSLRYRRKNTSFNYTKSVLIEADKLTVDEYRRQVVDLANNYGLSTGSVINTVHVLGLEYLAQGLDCESSLFKLKMIEYRTRSQRHYANLAYHLADKLEFDTFLNMCSQAGLNGQELLNNKGNDSYEFLGTKDISYHLLANFFSGQRTDFWGSGKVDDSSDMATDSVHVQVCHKALKDQLYAIKNNLACNVSAATNWAHIHGAILLNDLYESRKDSAGYWLNLYAQNDRTKDYKNFALMDLYKLQATDKFTDTCAGVGVDSAQFIAELDKQRRVTVVVAEADRTISEWLTVLLAEQEDRSLDTISIRAQLIARGAISDSDSDWANVRQLAARYRYTTDQKGIWSLPN